MTRDIGAPPWWQWLVMVVVGVVPLVVLVRYGGAVGDQVAIGLPFLALVGFAVLIALRWIAPTWQPLALAFVLTAVALTVGPRVAGRTEPPERPVTIASVNVKAKNAEPEAAARSVLALDADVVVVSEVTLLVDSLLAPSYPYSSLLEVRGRGSGLGVYSRLPMEELGSDLEGRLLRLRVDGRDPFELVAVHLPRPWFTDETSRARTGFDEHREFVRRLDHIADARSAGLPVVIAGDLNLSDRTWGYRVITEGRHDLARASWAESTFRGLGKLGPVWSTLMLRIDYVFVDDGWCVGEGRTERIGGSDHVAVIGAIGPCPSTTGSIATEPSSLEP